MECYVYLLPWLYSGQGIILCRKGSTTNSSVFELEIVDDDHYLNPLDFQVVNVE